MKHEQKTYFICAFYNLTDNTISSEGKGTVIIAKLLGGEIFSILVGTILLLSAQLPHLIFNGVHGLGAPCQIVVPFTS